MKQSYQKWIKHLSLVVAVVVVARAQTVRAEEEKVVTEVAVRTAKVSRATLHGYVTAYGTIEPEAPGQRAAAGARLAPAVAGVVTEVKCWEGEKVEKGAALFQLDDRAADVVAERAADAVKFASANLARQKKLMEVEGTSQKLVLEAEHALSAAEADLAAAKTQQAMLRVSAPFAGTVTRVNVKPGEAVDLTTVLGELVDLDRLVAAVNVPGGELRGLKPGQAADIEVGSSEAPFKGAVATIGSQVDAKSGTAVVRISLPANSGLMPGEFVTARIAREEHKDVLAVPVACVVRDGDGGTVIALVENDKATQKTVKTGLRDAGLVEVEGDGLKEGQTVVSEGAYGLPKETKVRVMADAASSTSASAVSSALSLKQTIPLPDVKGGFDLMAVDLQGQRLFVNAEDNNTTEVIDLAAGKLAKTIAGMHEPKWPVYRPELNKLYVANGDGVVRVLDAQNYEPKGEIKFREKANNLRYDAETAELFVGVGKTFGAIAVVNAKADKIATEIDLANFPKQFEIDGNRIYVNVPTANQVAVIDRREKAVVATWPVKEAKENVPMAIDRIEHRLFIGCQTGKLVVLNTATGNSVASLDIDGDADGISYDASRHLIYISCGEGFIDVVRQQDADHYEMAEKVATAKGAATSLFVPELHRLFLAVPQRGNEAAEVRVFETAQ